MHLSSAALLLLLVPASRAAAIPNQGGPPAGSIVPIKGDLANAVLSGVVGPAPVRRDEATNPLASIGNTPAKLEETVSEAASNAASGITTTKRDAADDELKKNLQNLKWEQIGPLVQLLKAIGGTGAISKRDAPLLLSDLDLAALESLGLILPSELGSDAKATRDTTGDVEKTAETTGQLSPEALKNAEDLLKALQFSLGFTSGPLSQRRNIADPLAPAAAAPAAPAAPVDPAVAGLTDALTKAFPTLSTEEVAKKVASIIGRPAAKYVKREGPTVYVTVDGEADHDISTLQISTSDFLNGARDTAGDNVDAANVVDSTAKAAAGAVEGVTGQGLGETAQVDDLVADLPGDVPKQPLKLGQKGVRQSINVGVEPEITIV